MGVCRECGYLGVRDSRHGKTHEATKAFRERGMQLCPTEKTSGECFCIVGGEAFPTSDEAAKGPAVVKLDGSCKDFIQWQQGLTPKEHIMVSLVERWRRADEDWKEAMERQHEETLRQSRRQHLIDLLVFGVLVTAIMVTGQIIAAMISSQIIFNALP